MCTHTEYGKLLLILFGSIICTCAISTFETWVKTDNVIITNNLLSYTRPCTSSIEAAAVCKTLDKTKYKAILYDAGSSTCRIFSYSLQGMFNVSQTPTGLAYLETLCDADAVAYDEAHHEGGGFCSAHQQSYTRRQDCHAYFDDGYREDGIYTLYVNDSFVDVWCEFDTNNGWTVIQRRQDGSQDFDLLWADYKQGFGDLNNEYWLGNENIYQMSKDQDQKLQIYLVAPDGTEITADYTLFYIGNETEKYYIFTDGFSGAYGDALAHYDNKRFSTRDADNDHYPTDGYNCAAVYTGGWWFSACHHGNMNGRYGQGLGSRGINWHPWKSTFVDCFVRTVMKITRHS